MVGGDGCGEGVELDLDIFPVNLFRFVVSCCSGLGVFPYNKRKTSLCSR